MRNLLLLLILLAPLSCATASYSSGRDFDSSKIELVRENETTTAQLIAWFGQPESRSITGQGQEVWVYQHITTNAVAGAFAFHTEMRSDVKTKQATFVIRDGVVESFSATIPE